MTANNDAHVKAGLLGALIASDIIYEDGGRYYIGLHGDSDCTDALDAAIRALSADRGEAVASAGDGDAVAWRTETPYGVGYLFADELIEAGVCLEGKPPSPAESAEGVLGYIGAGVAVNLFTGYSVTTTITPHKAMLDDVAIYQRPAAPSQVSDAMVERACAGYMRCRFPECDWPADWGPTTQAEIRQELRAALEAAQPQPGRVEGMVLVPVDEIERAVKVMRYAAHPHASPNADALAKFMPTAGGDA